MKNNKIFPGVHLGKNYFMGDYTILGIPPKGAKDGEFETIIGENSYIRSHTAIYAGNKIGNNFQTGHHVMIREFNEIGDNVSIGTNSVIEHHIKMGNNVRIHSNTFIPEFSILKDRVWIGPNVVLTNVYHPLCPKAKECLKGPIIYKNAKIGANSTILPDIKIGENSLIGAGSVVVKDVPPNVVVAGNPAKIMKKIEDLRCPYDLISRPY